MRCLLDTSTCIPLINRSDVDLARRVLGCAPVTVALCSAVVAEPHFGARNATRVAEDLELVERFCEPFAPLPFDDTAAVEYGVIRAQLRRGGPMIGSNDLMIAPVARSAELILVTRNVDELRRVPGLAVEAW